VTANIRVLHRYHALPHDHNCKSPLPAHERAGERFWVHGRKAKSNLGLQILRVAGFRAGAGWKSKIRNIPVG
jgi:hypothetical protein